MSDRDPYRDERESLVAENERLRAALGSARRGQHRARGLWLAGVVLAGLHGAALVYLPGLINAGSDGRVYLGGALAVLLLMLDVVYATRLVARRTEAP